MRGIIKCMSQVAIIALLPSLALAHDGHHKQRNRVIEIRVTEAGFVPARVEARAGQPVTLVFRRTTEHTCATEAVFPSLGRTLALPLNKSVRTTLRPRSKGTIEFACGMGMYTGQVVVR